MTDAPSVSCGSCRKCCKALGVEELDKPPGEWCKHACSIGCRIYDTRPHSCQIYECVWLASQKREGALCADLRPDRSRIVIDLPDRARDVVLFRVDPADRARLQNPKIQNLLAIFHKAGLKTIIVSGDRRSIIAVVAEGN